MKRFASHAAAAALLVTPVWAWAQPAIFQGADLKVGEQLIAEHKCAACHTRRVGGDGLPHKLGGVGDAAKGVGASDGTGCNFAAVVKWRLEFSNIITITIKNHLTRGLPRLAKVGSLRGLGPITPANLAKAFRVSQTFSIFRVVLNSANCGLGLLGKLVRVQELGRDGAAGSST